MPKPRGFLTLSLLLVAMVTDSQAGSARINSRLITPDMEQAQVRALAGAPHDRQRREGPGGRRYGSWVYRCRYRDSNCRPDRDGEGRTVWILFDRGRVVDVHHEQH